MISSDALSALVFGVQGKAEVYKTDLDTALVEASQKVKPEELALTGVAHFVFNTLRGAEDTVDGATFEDVRAIIAAEGNL
jgi:hypothetical protein